jgi:phosphoribosyl 1,2-cyclic phosphodiesterase
MGSAQCAEKTATAVELAILGSGSSGNAALLSTAGTRLLIDAGLSKRETLKRLTEIGMRPASGSSGIDAILLSHEHADHAAHLASLAEEFGVPVFLTEGTRERLEKEWKQSAPISTELFCPGQRFSVGDIDILPFVVPHDAAEPVGFRFKADGVSIGFVVDLGFLTTLVREHLRGCEAVVLEANHDLEMLRHGPYPWFIKQRVMSRLGHLSNAAMAEFLEFDFDGRAHTIVLAHLSENNNSPEMARLTAEQALARRRDRFPLSLATEPELLVTTRRAPLAPIRF